MNFGEILKLGITLMIVGIISGTVLTFAHGVTAPVIERQQIAAIEDSMFAFFPEADEMQIEEVDGKEYYVVKSGGEEIGFGTRAVAGGYGGDVQMMVAVDTEGTIMGIDILAHEETPGLGDVIEEEHFREEFVGIEFPEAVGATVDTISGATASTNAAITGAERGRDTLAYQYLGFEEPEDDVDVASVPDGTYEGEGQGFNDVIRVEVTVEGGEIIEIEVLEHSDTPDFWEEGKQTIDDIIEAQSTDVDTETGATGSSEGIQAAVIDALIDEVE